MHFGKVSRHFFCLHQLWINWRAEWYIKPWHGKRKTPKSNWLTKFPSELPTWIFFQNQPLLSRNTSSDHYATVNITTSVFCPEQCCELLLVSCIFVIDNLFWNRLFGSWNWDLVILEQWFSLGAMRWSWN